MYTYGIIDSSVILTLIEIIDTTPWTVETF